ncbi:hypothetical protein A8135_05840 [Legionella jamestowniensis]|uniref:Substrate of the Dot/Icm secretion system n=1 Tax=Legionella jamestowniensis TaxID=455 RepID=A0ABX2XRA3_9GAMM|nr:hypothetical protein [Legionella jamestowniensis]OCH97147.1 hypothetical protein A8135_05840 [Legionella jamestowniensis]
MARETWVRIKFITGTTIEICIDNNKPIMQQIENRLEKDLKHMGLFISSAVMRGNRITNKTTTEEFETLVDREQTFQSIIVNFTTINPKLKKEISDGIYNQVLAILLGTREGGPYNLFANEVIVKLIEDLVKQTYLEPAYSVIPEAMYKKITSDAINKANKVYEVLEIKRLHKKLANDLYNQAVVIFQGGKEQQPFSRFSGEITVAILNELKVAIYEKSKEIISEQEFNRLADTAINKAYRVYSSIENQKFFSSARELNKHAAIKKPISSIKIHSIDASTRAKTLFLSAETLSEKDGEEVKKITPN